MMSCWSGGPHAHEQLTILKACIVPEMVWRST